MNIFLTGGSGFVGKNIISELKSKYNIHAPSSSELNLVNSDELEAYINQYNFKFIINCAVRGGRRTNIDTEKDFYNNIKILDNLLKYTNDNRKLITFSSGAEIYNLESYYGFSKKISTSLIKDNKNIKNLRIYNVFGESGMKDSFVYTAVEKCLMNEDIVVWDDKYFDIFYIKDLIKIIDNLMIEDSFGYEEIDCVYEQKYKLSEIANLIKKLSNSKSNIIIKNDTNSIYTGIFTRRIEEPTPLNISLNKMISHIRESQ